MNLHMQPIKVHRVMIYSPKKRKEKRGFQSSLLLFHPLLLVKLLLHLITNWNPKWLTDFRCHVSTVRMLTERVRPHLYPIPSPTAVLVSLDPADHLKKTVVLPFPAPQTVVFELDPNSKALFFFFLEGELLERRKVRLSFKHLVVFFSLWFGKRPCSCT